MSSISINELRLSFVWFKQLSGLLDGSTPDAPMAFLGNEKTFNAKFNEVFKLLSDLWSNYDKTYPPPNNDDLKQYSNWEKEKIQKLGASLSDPTILLPPRNSLNPTSISKIWDNTIEKRNPWKFIVPLRSSFAAHLKTEKPQDSIWAEGMLYPHGVGLVITYKLRPENKSSDPENGMTLDQAVTHAVQVRNDDQILVNWNEGINKPYKLDALASALLDDLCKRTLGQGIGLYGSRPFSVVTVIRGSGVISAEAIVPDGTIHRVLEALCNFNSNWHDSKLHDLKTSGLRIRFSAPSGHVLYALERGRAVWFPSEFQKKQSYKRTLGCYHRNLTLLHIQTEALAQVLSLRADFLENGLPLPLALDNLAKNASGFLGRLYGSSEKTYQSSSPRAAIDANPSLKKLIDQARKDYNMEPLHWEEFFGIGW